MKTYLVSYVPKYFTKKSINTFFILIIVCSIIFYNYLLPLHFILFCIVEVYVFFYLTTYFTIRYQKITAESYINKIFWISFFLRFLWVVFSYFYFISVNHQPFEYQVADALGYHGEGMWLSDLLKTNKFDIYLDYIGNDYSDMGYPLYLGIIYFLIGDNIFIVRILKAVIGSYTSVLIYKIAKNNFGESTGRIAGILSMTLPNLIYYCGLHVKEVEMTFLICSFIYYADSLLRSKKLIYSHLWYLTIFGFSLFLFRTVLAVSLILSFIISIPLYSNKVTKIFKKFTLLMFCIFGIYMIINSPLQSTILEYVDQSGSNLEAQMQHFSTREGGNSLAKYGSRSIFLPFAIMAPFPTLVDTNQLNSMMLGGALFTRNIYAFFVLLGLYIMLKKKMYDRHFLILLSFLSYMFVIASSGFALSERFHVPLIPFLLLLCSFGMSQVDNTHKRYFVPYLYVISIIIIGWNLFKLTGRGLI